MRSFKTTVHLPEIGQVIIERGDATGWLPVPHIQSDSDLTDIDRAVIHAACDAYIAGMDAGMVLANHIGD